MIPKPLKLVILQSVGVDSISSSSSSLSLKSRRRVRRKGDADIVREKAHHTIAQTIPLPALPVWWFLFTMGKPCRSPLSTPRENHHNADNRPFRKVPFISQSYTTFHHTTSPSFRRTTQPEITIPPHKSAYAGTSAGCSERIPRETKNFAIPVSIVFSYYEKLYLYSFIQLSILHEIYTERIMADWVETMAIGHRDFGQNLE